MAVLQIRLTSSSSSAAPTTALLANTTSGSKLIVAIGWYNNVNISSVTDTQGNSYSLLLGPTQHPSDTLMRLAVYTATVGSSAADTVTVNFSGTATFINIYVCECTNLGVADGAATTTGNVGTTGTITSINGPSITTTSSEATVFGFLYGYRNSCQVTIPATLAGSPYTLLANNTGNVGSGFETATFYSTGSYTGKYTLGFNDLYIAATFAWASTDPQAVVRDSALSREVTTVQTAAARDSQIVREVAAIQNATARDSHLLREVVAVNQGAARNCSVVREVVIPATPTVTTDVYQCILM